MYIKEIQLRNFRNIDFCSIQFNEKTNIILGKNAQGKTNILESLVFLSSTRSHRLAIDQHLIKHEKDCSTIDCYLNDEEKDKKLTAVIHQRGKTLMINKNPVARSSEFIGNLNVVLFSPSDLNLFEDSPKERRKIVDVEIGKISPLYMIHLSKYMKLLKERNMLLKMNRINDSYNDILESQMIEEQKKILLYRYQFIDEINKTLMKYYEKLSGQSLVIQCFYESCVEINKDIDVSLRKMMDRQREKDVQYRSTSAGIHRDDFIFKLEGRKVEEVASQGQKRMVILAFKLSLLDYIKNMTKKLPVLLLDDVMSELDSEKRRNLFNAIPQEIQTVITTTDSDELKKEIQQNWTIFKLSDGKIVTREDKE